MMATEQEYDDVVAPMLAEVAAKCKELGMSLIARVEWEPNKSGITQMNPKISAGQKLTWYAVHSHGNIDKLCLSLIKQEDVSQSIVLNGWGQN